MDYFKFNGIKSTDKDMILLNYTPVFLPAKNIKFVKIPDKDGFVVQGAGKRDGIIIRCEVAIIGENEEQVLNKVEQINIWLKDKGKLEFWDMPDRYYMGEIADEIHMLQKITWNEFILIFNCDPIKYGQTVTQYLDGEEKLNNGTYEAEGTINLTVTEPTSYIDVELINTGDFLYIEHEFLVGDYVEIDLKKQYVKKNNVLITKDLYIESDFFKIPSGNYLIKITPSTVLGNITYIEQWL
jgi:predicted phage tail component-like protein